MIEVNTPNKLVLALDSSMII